MNKLIWFILASILLTINSPASAQSETEKLDLPGDNLNLYALMKLFQESPNLEAFEKKLNEEQSLINNLDLNGDEQIDYIRVSDNVNGLVHTITLDVAVSENEDQNVAVFFIEKKKDGKAFIQLVGDEDLYGKDYIIEPNEKQAPVEDNYISTREISSGKSVPVNISSWQIVRYIFAPSYSVWHSPWRWRYYPSYWRPWRPRFWHSYYGYHYHWHNYYNVHYRRWKYFRNPSWYGQYYGANFRSRSVIVKTKTARGDYRTTYSRPATAKEGSALFVKKYPNAQSSSYRLPAFDKTGKPVISKAAPVRPVTSKKKSVKGKKRKSSTRRKYATSKSSRNKQQATKPSTRTGSKPASGTTSTGSSSRKSQ
jgi:hypothetical protein